MLLDAVPSRLAQNILSKVLVLFREDGYIFSDEDVPRTFLYQEHFSEVFHC